MLVLRAKLGDLANRVELVGNTVSFGESKMETFCSPHLTVSLGTYHQCDVAWVGEDKDPFATEGRAPPKSEAYKNFFDFEGVAVFLRDKAGAREIELARTATGSCPLYVSANGDILTASWRFEDAVLALADRQPNVDACRIYLEHGTCQVRDMVIAGVHMLWPGESLKFDHAGLTFYEIDEPNIVLPGSLRDDARATDEFIRIIEGILRPRIERSSSAIIELSGGLDSSCVALAASHIARSLNSYGLIHSGAMGVQQRNRREEMISLCGLNDFTYPSAKTGPLASLELDECSLTPFDDIYRIPCTSAVSQHPAKNFDLLITGIGGDELSMENTFYRHEWEVRGHSALSSISGAVGRCDMFMRLGIWVTQPLIHPHVVNFCRALPEKMRANRMINFLTLARAGLSDGFLFPRYQEHYGSSTQYEASQFDFEKALRGSILAGYAIKDYGPLLSRAYESGYGGLSYELITELILYMKLDTVLKRYIS